MSEYALQFILRLVVILVYIDSHSEENLCCQKYILCEKMVKELVVSYFIVLALAVSDISSNKIRLHYRI